MAESVHVACVQLNSGPEIEPNLDNAARLIIQAAQDGADFIATPENTDFMAETPKLALETALDTENHPGVKFFSSLANKLSVTLLIGSMKIKVSETKMANRSFLFAPSGQLIATYDKIHLFDVDLPTGESHRESDEVEAGTKAAVANVAFGKVGLSICYDLRFPYLYRAMAQRDADILTIPAAFTVPTGQAHWETLLRARAIETGTFVVAPAQVGEHAGGRKTYGHSMIVGPWGQVLAENKKDEPGIIMRKIYLLDGIKARTAIPALKHDRKFDFYNLK